MIADERLVPGLDVSYAEFDICPKCKEHCDFIKEDEDGEELEPNDPGYDEAEAVSNCCGVRG